MSLHRRSSRTLAGASSGRSASAPPGIPLSSCRAPYLSVSWCGEPDIAAAWRGRSSSWNGVVQRQTRGARNPSGKRDRSGQRTRRRSYASPQRRRRRHCIVVRADETPARSPAAAVIRTRFGLSDGPVARATASIPSLGWLGGNLIVRDLAACRRCSYLDLLTK